MTSANYNVVADAHQQAKAIADKGRIFALFLRVHHRDYFPESSPAESSKRKYKKRRVAASDVLAVEKAPPKNTRTAPAPSWLPRDILELIMRLIDPLTLSDVLEVRQRGLYVAKVTDFGRLNEPTEPLAFLNAPIVVKHGFPGFVEQDKGFKWHEVVKYHEFKNMLALEMHQGFDADTTGHATVLIWNVEVDLKRVVINEATSDIEFPPTAVRVYTNATRVICSKMTPARAQEMLRYKLRGIMRKSGDVDFFEVDRSIDDVSGLRFQIKTATGYLRGMILDAHAGIAVGDRVRIRKAYKAYEHCVLDREGVVRGISLQSFVLFYVELADEDAEVSQQIMRAHERGNGTYKGQAKHHVECQRFHLEPCV